MSGDRRLQAQSRARIRAERNGDPNWTDLGEGWFALHIQYGGGAVTVHFDGDADADAFREWLEFHWPSDELAAANGSQAPAAGK